MPTVQFQEENELIGGVTPLAANMAVGTHTTPIMKVSDFHGVYIEVIVGDSVGGDGTIEIVPYEMLNRDGDGFHPLVDYIPEVVEDLYPEGGVVGIYIPTTALNSQGGYEYLQVLVIVENSVFYYTMTVYGHKPRWQSANTDHFIQLVTRDV